MNRPRQRGFIDITECNKTLRSARTALRAQLAALPQTLVFRLQGAVGNTKAFAQQLLNLRQNAWPLRQRIDVDMGRQCMLAGGQTPDMQVVHRLHAVDLAQRPAHLGRLDARRHALHQHLSNGAQQPHG